MVQRPAGRGRPQFQKFSDWVKENFPGLGSATITDAVWFATEFSTAAVEFPADLTHPVNIREWHREQAMPDEAPPFDLETPPVPQPPVLAPRDAERLTSPGRSLERASEGSTAWKPEAPWSRPPSGPTAAVLEALHLGENLGEVPW